MKNLKSFKSISVISCVILFIVISFGFVLKDYHLNGEITGADGTVIKLTYRYDGKDIVDSAILKNSKFILKGAFPESVRCTLTNSANQQIKIFIAQNTVMQIVGSLQQFYNLSIKGSAENDSYQAYKEKSLKLSNEYRMALTKSGADRHDKKTPEYLAFSRKTDSLTQDFIKKNSNSSAATLAIIDSYIGNNERKRAEVSYKLLSPEVKNTAYGKRIKQFVDTELTIQPGNIAPNFTLKDLKGKSLNTADYRGKYLLLDFWASWCPPCRAEHPFLRQLYVTYGKDIVFVSVGMDASDSAWKEAVKVDKLTWTQLNDPLSTNGEVADSYGIKSLPFNCIIAPDGKILATKLRGEKLEAFLAELFKKL